MISRFHIHDGQCDFRQRWARTDKWKLERAAGRALFGAYRDPLTDDESVEGKIAARPTQRLDSRREAVRAERGFAGARHECRDARDRGLYLIQRQDDRSDLHGASEVDPKSGNMIAFGYASSGLCTEDCTLYEVTPRASWSASCGSRRPTTA